MALVLVTTSYDQSFFVLLNETGGGGLWSAVVVSIVPGITVCDWSVMVQVVGITEHNLPLMSLLNEQPEERVVGV